MEILKFYFYKTLDFFEMGHSIENVIIGLIFYALIICAVISFFFTWIFFVKKDLKQNELENDEWHH